MSDRHLDQRLGERTPPPLSRGTEISDLLNAVQDHIIPFIKLADEDRAVKKTGHGLSAVGGGPRTALLEHHKPSKLSQLMDLNLPESPGGQDAFLGQVQQILQYSVNTWDTGFLSKLYGSTDAPGLASELLLATLNTNVHVYNVSPALTLIEKYTAKALASLFGLVGPHAGGINLNGGSMSNTTSIVVARNSLHPSTRTNGNAVNGLRLVLFTSTHGHYSIEQAVQMLGLGSSAVWSVPVHPDGSMDPTALEASITKARDEGFSPFYVNATAGTTVLGSYDPISPIANICKAHNLWLHIDASWGGPAIFSPAHRHKLEGSHLADSIAINPHKMMGVPITCSFLLGSDMRQFRTSNTSSASYLFHSPAPGSGEESHDLADLTLQCGRRGDSLKLYLGWVYHGSEGYRRQVEGAFNVAVHFATLVAKHQDLVLVSENPPPCLQVCFFYARDGKIGDAEESTEVTKSIVQALIPKGFLVDYASLDERGAFLRCVVNRGTPTTVVEGLVEAVGALGAEISGSGR